MSPKQTSSSPRKASSGSSTVLPCLTSVEELANSEVWIVKAPSTMNVGKLHDRVLNSLEDLPFEAVASKKNEEVTVLATDKNRKLGAVNVMAKGRISLREKVSPSVGNFEFCQVEAPKFSTPPERKHWTGSAEDGSSSSSSPPRKRRKAK